MVSDIPAGDGDVPYLFFDSVVSWETYTLRLLEPYRAVNCDSFIQHRRPLDSYVSEVAMIEPWIIVYIGSQTSNPICTISPDFSRVTHLQFSRTALYCCERYNLQQFDKHYSLRKLPDFSQEDHQVFKPNFP